MTTDARKEFENYIEMYAGGVMTPETTSAIRLALSQAEKAEGLARVIEFIDPDKIHPHEKELLDEALSAYRNKGEVE